MNNKIHAICLRKNGKAVPVYLDNLEIVLEFGAHEFVFAHEYEVGEYRFAIYLEK